MNNPSSPAFRAQPPMQSVIIISSSKQPRRFIVEPHTADIGLAKSQQRPRHIGSSLAVIMLTPGLNRLPKEAVKDI